jgi:hypothetical protein
MIYALCAGIESCTTLIRTRAYETAERDCEEKLHVLHNVFLSD